jgi:hypothetical protein
VFSTEIPTYVRCGVNSGPQRRAIGTSAFPRATDIIRISVVMEEAGQWPTFLQGSLCTEGIQQTYPAAQKAAPIVKQFTAQSQNEAIILLNRGKMGQCAISCLSCDDPRRRPPW